ncbi:MAG: type II secretion system protein J [Gemmatimonadales bacterium]
MMRRAGERAPGEQGGSLLEMVVALFVGLMVVGLALTTLARFQTVRADMAARTDALVALRMGRHVLRSELRNGVPYRDWTAWADSVALRAFRGAGRVCGLDSVPRRLVVAYEGQRAPDPSKDSVLLVDERGATTVRALIARRAAYTLCPAAGGAESELWTLDRDPETPPVAARIFERGSYHLSAAALRYRRGASGRQPLTPEVLSAGSHWEVSAQRLRMELAPSGAAETWSGFLAWLGPA